MLSRRLSSQIIQLHHLVSAILGLIDSSSTASLSGSPVKDAFGLRKLILVSTKVSKTTDNLVLYVFDPVTSSTAGVLDIFLIDTVNGGIVYSNTHKRAFEPVHIVHSENWIVYSFFSEKSRRTELVALDLYEGIVQRNTTDLFYTRVTPSKTFDVLKDDFEYWLITAVLSALVTGAYVTKRLASRKALMLAWK
ncbi:unnamed protein product [Nesidiocoris tenuis]|uniref:ER membrane protein complex subunit 1 n=1 Tax=Nesidiocoris tenuis TaxID=355587 RepID=A0A6H5FZ43_9HEMI|nr:unnamed protein product [Nesidiocoris tenuis]